MGAERAAPERGRRMANPIELSAVVTVVAAFTTFETWFFFFAGHPVTGA
jgi:hypothetical protein